MKEIVYIQAGNISNHIGTHFWNAQQSYFTYREGEEVLVDHDVSFREGVSPRVSRSPDVPLEVTGSDATAGRTNILPTTASI